MKLYLVIGHTEGYYLEDYNLICVCDSEEKANQVIVNDTIFDSYDIETCNLNERIV